MTYRVVGGTVAGLSILLLMELTGCVASEGKTTLPMQAILTSNVDSPSVIEISSASDVEVLDTPAYDRQVIILNTKDSMIWPIIGPHPLPGAILPFKRIIAYYGNLYSKGMGILGELPEEQMVAKLQSEVEEWNAADTSTPAIPALHYIAVTAQPDPGKGNKYRLRMPFHQIDKVLAIAEKIDALVFIDIQVGHSTLEEEIPALENYLKLPNVHLGIDAEYSMKNGQVPCVAVGTFDAVDINYAIRYLSDLVQRENIPPKMLIVHRFTNGMITNSQKIKPTQEVQVVMHMDGFGDRPKKESSYRSYITRQPVQFTGFKLFYKNDARLSPNKRVMSPAEVLELYPKPIYIQYQ